MSPFELHHQVKRGNLHRVREILPQSPDVNRYDNRGYTPLMHAVESPNAGVNMMLLLLEHGASIHQECSEPSTPSAVLAMCIRAGDLQKLTVLLEAGADVHYKTTDGFDALIEAAYSRDVPSNPDLIELLELLIARGAPLNGMTT